jgi:hypothetical protein
MKETRRASEERREMRVRGRGAKRKRKRKRKKRVPLSLRKRPLSLRPLTGEGRRGR